MKSLLFHDHRVMGDGCPLGRTVEPESLVPHFLQGLSLLFHSLGTSLSVCPKEPLKFALGMTDDAGRQGAFLTCLGDGH